MVLQTIKLINPSYSILQWGTSIVNFIGVLNTVKRHFCLCFQSLAAAECTSELYTCSTYALQLVLPCYWDCISLVISIWSSEVCVYSVGSSSINMCLYLQASSVLIFCWTFLKPLLKLLIFFNYLWHLASQ